MMKITTEWVSLPDNQELADSRLIRLAGAIRELRAEVELTDERRAATSEALGRHETWHKGAVLTCETPSDELEDLRGRLRARCERLAAVVVLVKHYSDKQHWGNDHPECPYSFYRHVAELLRAVQPGDLDEEE